MPSELHQDTASAEGYASALMAAFCYPHLAAKSFLRLMMLQKGLSSAWDAFSVEQMRMAFLWHYEHASWCSDAHTRTSQVLCEFLCDVRHLPDNLGLHLRVPHRTLRVPVGAVHVQGARQRHNAAGLPLARARLHKRHGEGNPLSCDDGDIQ
jgi:hypothetical protein